MRGRGERERDEKKAKVNQYAFQYIIHVVYVMCMYVIESNERFSFKKLTSSATHWACKLLEVSANSGC